MEVVYADVFVTRDGAPVSGLTAANFEVLDNGVRQKVELADMEEMPVTAVLVFDMSTSVAGEKLAHLRAAGHAFLDGLRPKDRAALLTFSHALRLQADFGGDLPSLHRALDRIQADGSTALHDALYAGIKLPETSVGRPLVVLFTDGQDNMSWLTEEEALTAAREASALVYAVGIESGSEERPLTDTARMMPGGRFPPPIVETATELDFVRRVAEATGGRLFRADSSAGLKAAFLGILRELNSRYLVRYEPQGVGREGWHRLEVRLKGRKGRVRARPGYFVAGTGGGRTPTGRSR